MLMSGDFWSDKSIVLLPTGAHSDWANITFLTHDGTPGLQVLYQGEVPLVLVLVLVLNTAAVEGGGNTPAWPQ